MRHPEQEKHPSNHHPPTGNYNPSTATLAIQWLVFDSVRFFVCAVLLLPSNGMQLLIGKQFCGPLIFHSLLSPFILLFVICWPLKTEPASLAHT